MVVRTATQRPVQQTVLRLYWAVVDGSVPESQQAIFIELPVLVPVRAKPVLCIVMPFVREAHRDAVVGKRPQFLDESIVQLTLPLPGVQAAAFFASRHKFRAVSPTAIDRIGERHLLQIGRA